MGRSRACQVKGKLLLNPFPLLESVLCTFLLCNLECAPNTVCVLSFALVKGNTREWRCGPTGTLCFTFQEAQDCSTPTPSASPPAVWVPRLPKSLPTLVAVGVFYYALWPLHKRNRGLGAKPSSL